jgi:hypothetical protein
MLVAEYDAQLRPVRARIRKDKIYYSIYIPRQHFFVSRSIDIYHYGAALATVRFMVPYAAPRVPYHSGTDQALFRP